MATLGQLKRDGTGLMANCKGQNCGHGKRLPIDRLISMFGENYDMIRETRIAAACKCEACGHKGATIHLHPKTSPNAYAKAKGG